MSTIPKFASNKKYWQILNKLVFGAMRYCVLAAARVFRRAIATDIYGASSVARSIVQPATRLAGYTA